VQGVQQQVVGHWQSWLFLLVVSPDTPNGELLVAPVDAPQQHTVSRQLAALTWHVGTWLACCAASLMLGYILQGCVWPATAIICGGDLAGSQVIAMMFHCT
jgi:hypothetical protein